MREVITTTARASTIPAQKIPAHWIFGSNRFVFCKTMAFQEYTGILSSSIKVIELVVLCRITRSLKMHVYHLRWIAKLNFNSNVSYEFKELRQFGKFLTHLPGVDCAWVHPKTDEKYSLLVKFDKHRVPSKKFFNPQGFHSWDDINSQYQGM